MKKRTIFLAMLMVLSASIVWAQGGAEFRSSKSSGEQTADAAIFSNDCYIASLLIITDGTNDARVVIYDNTAGSGKVIFDAQVAGADGYGGRNWAFPVECNTGLYADVTGTGASYIVEYIPR